MYTRRILLVLSSLFAILLACSLPLGFMVSAQELHPAPGITSVPPGSIFTVDNYGLGQAVAVSGNWLASSMPHGSLLSDVLLYRRTALGAPWQYHSKIAVTDDPTQWLPYMSFGARIALDGDILAIAAPAANLPTYREGAVYVYHRVADVWQQEATLVSADLAFGGEFGDSIAVDGDNIVVGTYNGAHAAYIFQRTASSPPRWTQTAALLPQTPAESPHSKAVAIHGDAVAVSTPLFSRVYVFGRNQGGADHWGQVADLAGVYGYAFGKAISLYGDILAIGEPADGINGSVHVFQHDAAASPPWQPVVTLAAPADTWEFGTQVAAGDGIILTNGQATNGNASPLPVFVRNFGGVNAWGQAMELLPGDISAPDLTLFGFSLDLDGSTAVVGAPQADSFATYEDIQPKLFFDVVPSSFTPRPGERLAWSLRLYNSTNHVLAGAAMSVTLPSSLSLAAPVTLTPAQPNAQLAQTNADLPPLAVGLVISPGLYTTLAATVQVPPSAPIAAPLATTFTLSAASPQGQVVLAASTTVTTQAHSGYLPLLAKPLPVYLPPGVYPAHSCAAKPLVVEGIDVGQLYECVNGVEVLGNGYMRFHFAWSADLVEGRTHIVKYSDAGNRNMYLADNLGNRYDHVAVGGAAEGGTLYDGQPIDGWFLFPPAQRAATIFAFHDDDQGLLLGNIVLPQ